MAVSTEIPPATAVRQPGHEPKCSVCTDPRRIEIDRHLLESSVRLTATRFGLSKSAVHRHRASHLCDLLSGGRSLADSGSRWVTVWRQRLYRVHAETEAFLGAIEGTDPVTAARVRAILARQRDLARQFGAVLPEPTGPGKRDSPGPVPPGVSL